MTEQIPGMEVPARSIPVPSSVSAEAQAVLAVGRMDRPDWPALDDVQAWLETRAVADELVLAMLSATLAGGDQVEDLDVDGVPVYVVTPAGFTTGDPRVYFDIHGGGLTMGGGECCRAFGRMTAENTAMKVWTVDYRMPPEHPYPAALDDCMAGYRALIDRYPAERVVVGGGSAGANLAAAMILRARDEGLPLPSATVLLTPELDLTESGDSFQTNLGVDTVLTNSLMPVNRLYGGGHDLADPYLSPLFGDFGKGFPPTMLSAGTRDLFLSNAVRMHRRLRAAGIHADLHVFEAMPHGGFMVPTPEEQDLRAEVKRFVETHCPLE
jgi:epsilon-lactone hydrolase